MRRTDKEIKDIKEIESIIKRTDVCRLAMTSDNIPYVVAMNFGYKSGTPSELFFHCATEGRKLDIIRKNNNVCFQMDTDHSLKRGDIACDSGMSYTSIIGYGKIFFVTDEEEKKTGLDCIMKHYTQKSMHVYNNDILRVTTVLRLVVTEMSCKKR